MSISADASGSQLAKPRSHLDGGILKAARLDSCSYLVVRRVYGPRQGEGGEREEAAKDTLWLRSVDFLSGAPTAEELIPTLCIFVVVSRD